MRVGAEADRGAQVWVQLGLKGFLYILRGQASDLGPSC